MADLHPEIVGKLKQIAERFDAELKQYIRPAGVYINVLQSR